MRRPFAVAVAATHSSAAGWDLDLDQSRPAVR
ncbi:hypothetical protein IW248_004667 [Micromonospora ureilytica]|uniref:Uncharacterized protein n=1 Tax=Micromonospora ureilytica TaxID=709868 RepID=A0ABS0JMX5_9ACTN|nr:hypothetical protein [Micromonospora ureilytica]